MDKGYYHFEEIPVSAPVNNGDCPYPPQCKSTLGKVCGGASSRYSDKDGECEQVHHDCRECDCKVGASG